MGVCDLQNTCGPLRMTHLQCQSQVVAYVFGASWFFCKWRGFGRRICVPGHELFFTEKILIVKWYYIDKLHLSVLYFVLGQGNATGKHMSFPRVVQVKVFPVMEDIPTRRVFNRTEEIFSTMTYNGGEKRRPDFFKKNIQFSNKSKVNFQIPGTFIFGISPKDAGRD